MKKVLGPKFFSRPTPVVARELLGKFLVRRLAPARRASPGRAGRAAKETAFMITETEAYDGFKDKGSHAHRGETKRNAPMFGPPGHWYVYFTYGFHWMLNIATRKRGYPAAVLIRALSPFSNSRQLENGREMLNGPGRLTKALKITGKLSGKPAVPRSGLWIEDRGVKIAERQIKKGPRVGIAYAGRYWAGRHWRFQLKEIVRKRSRG